MPQFMLSEPHTLNLRPYYKELDIRPPTPWKGSATPPNIVNMQTFHDVHCWADIKMGNYIVRPQDNHAVISAGPALDTMPDSRAFLLYANSARARIGFAEIVLKHLRNHEGINAGPLCFVTITPASCACRVGDASWWMHRRFRAERRLRGDAARFDVRIVQQIARQALGDIPFIGMVEAALFYRWRPGGSSYEDWVSWHCHLLVWGIPAKKLSKLLAPLRERHDSMRADLPSVHVQSVEQDDFERQFLYALKAPQKLYRMVYDKRTSIDPETGEVREPGWHMKKDWLQTGQRIRLIDIMGERTLDQLLYGNSDGTVLRRAIVREALAPFRRWEARQSYNRAVRTEGHRPTHVPPALTQHSDCRAATGNLLPRH